MSRKMVPPRRTRLGEMMHVRPPSWTPTGQCRTCNMLAATRNARLALQTRTTSTFKDQYQWRCRCTAVETDVLTEVGFLDDQARPDLWMRGGFRIKMPVAADGNRQCLRFVCSAGLRGRRHDPGGSSASYFRPGERREGTRATVGINISVRGKLARLGNQRPGSPSARRHEWTPFGPIHDSAISRLPSPTAHTRPTSVVHNKV